LRYGRPRRAGRSVHLLAADAIFGGRSGLCGRALVSNAAPCAFVLDGSRLPKAPMARPRLLPPYASSITSALSIRTQMTVLCETENFFPNPCFRGKRHGVGSSNCSIVCPSCGAPPGNRCRLTFQDRDLKEPPWTFRPNHGHYAWPVSPSAGPLVLSELPAGLSRVAAVVPRACWRLAGAQPPGDALGPPCCRAPRFRLLRHAGVGPWDVPSPSLRCLCRPAPCWRLPAAIVPGA